MEEASAPADRKGSQSLGCHKSPGDPRGRFRSAQPAPRHLHPHSPPLSHPGNVLGFLQPLALLFTVWPCVWNAPLPLVIPSYRSLARSLAHSLDKAGGVSVICAAQSRHCGKPSWRWGCLTPPFINLTSFWHQKRWTSVECLTDGAFPRAVLRHTCNSRGTDALSERVAQGPLGWMGFPGPRTKESGLVLE